MKQLICITCPKGCHLSIDETTLQVTGNSCPKGEIYAKNELTCPKRTVTTTVAIENAETARCPVKTSAPVDKGLMGDIVTELKKYTLTAPVEIGDLVVKNILNSGADIVVCRKL